LIILNVQYVSAAWVLVPNGSFESGTVGLIPENWIMVAWNYSETGVGNPTYIHEMKQTDQKYFDGSRSLWLHSRIVDTDGLRNSRGSHTQAETKDWINAPWATHVRVYIRDIKSTHSIYWGWTNSVYLRINNVGVAKTYYGGVWWDMIFRSWGDSQF